MCGAVGDEHFVWWWWRERSDTNSILGATLDDANFLYVTFTRGFRGTQKKTISTSFLTLFRSPG
jgi:hypothetical protein